MRNYYCKGALVKATSGREKGEIFVIMSIDNNFAYLVNGKSRPLENPKKKNIKHLFLISRSESTSLNMESLTNAHLIKYIKDFKKSVDYK